MMTSQKQHPRYKRFVERIHYFKRYYLDDGKIKITPPKMGDYRFSGERISNHAMLARVSKLEDREPSLSFPNSKYRPQITKYSMLFHVGDVLALINGEEIYPDRCRVIPIEAMLEDPLIMEAMKRGDCNYLLGKFVLMKYGDVTKESIKYCSKKNPKKKKKSEQVVGNKMYEVSQINASNMKLFK